MATAYRSMSETFYCPRGAGPDSPFNAPFNGEATWRDDGTCSYCGSLSPDLFMERLGRGDVLLSPTDKNYKVYVHNDGGEPFKQTYRDCPPGEPPHMPEACSHWVTRETEGTKFYFQHLSERQRRRFVELYNLNRLRFRSYADGEPVVVPRGFYRLPFFMQLVGTSHG